jgi:hypothetical protein
MRGVTARMGRDDVGPIGATDRRCWQRRRLSRALALRGSPRWFDPADPAHDSVAAAWATTDEMADWVRHDLRDVVRELAALATKAQAAERELWFWWPVYCPDAPSSTDQ